MALVPGVQYGLSSHDNFDEHKSLIFVKLTDSSYRAIQEYLKSRDKIIEKPKIQFLQNEGKLSIPSIHGFNGFTFSLSSNQDIEGPQGGFECVRQTGPKSLESLGAIPYKMRIRANDDVYETTRHRMAVAEENNKNKCTRVIKANGPDIGRKVKVQIGRTISLPSYAKHRESTTSIPTSGSNQHRASTNKSTASNSNSNHVAATRNPEKKISDIMRRPLKERLIHVLALRPYKKPELYDRINKEGLREKEKSIMMTILKQVAYMRDNTYHLQRHIWNDVQEDWPFYTEQEKTMLRRRKPQNLTPPGSSDGSSGSGQSPNSIHAGSPPAITAPPHNKRPGYYQGNDGVTTKKTRISHYKKPEPISFIPAGEKVSGSSSYSNNNSGISAAAGGERAAGGNSGCVVNSSSASGGGGGSGSGAGSTSNSSSKNGAGLDGWESRQHPQRERSSRADYRAERTANSDVPRGAGNGCGALAVPSGSSRPSYLTSSPSDSERNSHHQSGGHGRDDNVSANTGSGTNDIDRKDRNDRSDKGDRSRDAMREERNRVRECRNRSSAANDTNDVNDATLFAQSEASSSGAHIYNINASSTDVMMISLPTDELERPGSPREYPDYLTYYTTISNAIEKRRYKEEFYANYDEYRKLHSKVVVIANRFTSLYEQLQEYRKSGNLTEIEIITEQMKREYKEIKQDIVYQQMKKRFHYLHDKLSHIKRLILEYESENTVDTMSIATNVDSGMVSTTTAGTNVNIGDLDNQHY